MKKRLAALWIKQGIIGWVVPADNDGQSIFDPLACTDAQGFVVVVADHFHFRDQVGCGEDFLGNPPAGED